MIGEFVHSAEKIIEYKITQKPVCEVCGIELTWGYIVQDVEWIGTYFMHGMYQHMLRPKGEPHLYCNEHKQSPNSYWVTQYPIVRSFNGHSICD